MSFRSVRVFGITQTGLRAIAIAVVMLWSCIAMEAATRHRAEQDARVVRQTLRQLRQGASHVGEPAAVPSIAPARHAPRGTAV